jgi:hypothetical protein
MSSDDLFLTLDGRHAAALGQEWRIEVYGIHEKAGCRWVQLTVSGRSRQILTVAMAPTDGVQHVLMALGTWIAQGCGTGEPRIAHVA